MPPPSDHPNVQAVVAALRAGGAAASGARMRVLPDAVTTARAAADALGIEVGQIANSLIFVLERSAGPGEKPGTERSASGTSINTERSASGTSIGTERSASGTSIGTERSASGTSINTEPLLVLASGAHRVDTAKLAAQLGAVAIRRADQKFVRAATGQVIGGVAPVGHPARLRTVVDTALAEYAELWCGGGIPHAVFPTSFDELITLTGGTAAAVAEGS